MTDLDDALNTSAPVLAPIDVTVDWAELPAGVSADGADSLRDFGQQAGDSFQVKQSFDDGLPDAVTMATQNDASGSMDMGLIGRQPNIADVLTGWRGTTSSGNGSGTAITVTLPASLSPQDYIVVAITVDNTSGVYENSYPTGHPHGWKQLAEATDSTYTTYVFGISYWVGMPTPDFRINTTSSWSWCAGAMGAHYTANQASIVPVTPGVPVTAVEGAGAVTAHTGPYATLGTRGYVLGVFAAPNSAGPWVLASGGAQLVQVTGGHAAVQLVKTDLQNVSGDYRFVSNTTGATAVGMMVAIPMVVRDRPHMDAQQYFSPFNDDSPVHDFERDTAGITANHRIVSPNGVVSTTLFKGQMADLQVSGRSAQMSAVSRTRLLLDASNPLPSVFGRRENCTTDWLATWLMAHGGQYPGIAPSPYTRFWATCHGSIHASMAGGNSYSSALYHDTDQSPTGPYGVQYPQVVEGPFVTGMFAQQTNDRVETLYIVGDHRDYPKTVPGMETDQYDIVTDRNSVGRLTMWIRGDASAVAPAALSGGDDDLIQVIITANRGGGLNSQIVFRLNSARQPRFTMGNTVTCTGGDLPSDGQWHFFGVVWDYASGLARVRRDNVFWDLSGFSSAGTPMAPSEDWIFQNNYEVQVYNRVRLPVSELQLEAAPHLYTEQFPRFYPTPQAPSRNAVYRPTNQPLEAIYEPAPVQGWQALQELAQATLSHLRVNEDDNVEMVPLSYFGETAQMTVSAYNVADTEVNASDLTVAIDPSKMRNVATAQFPETRVDLNRSSVLDVTSGVTIPQGTTVMTFALETPAAEIHGAVSPYSSSWDLVKLTSSQVSGASALPEDNFFTPNKYPDGSGTVPSSGDETVKGKIISWSSSTVTIRFLNVAPWTMYLANDGSSVPSMRIQGYAIRAVEAYHTDRDQSSIGNRRERAVSTESKWIHRREEAVWLVSTLLSIVAHPRAELRVPVAGDPRRRPGQLISLADAEGTRAEGTWRILAIDHDGGGAKYVQYLQLTRVGAEGTWDEGLWDDSVWGA